MATTPRKTAAKKTTVRKTAPAKTTKTPRPDPFTDVVAAYPEEYLTCRDTGHTWRPTTARRESDGTIHRTLTCATCGTDRNQTLDRAGYIITNTYTYKAGYGIPGTGRLTSNHRAALRLASIDRSIDNTQG